MSRKNKRDYKEQRAFKDAEREAKRKDVAPPARRGGKPIGRMSLNTMPPWQRALVRALKNGEAARRRIDRGE